MSSYSSHEKGGQNWLKQKKIEEFLHFQRILAHFISLVNGLRGYNARLPY